MSKAVPQVLNLSDLTTKRKLMSKIAILSGLWEITLKPRKNLRTLTQNRFYWVAVVGPFTEWLREKWGDPDIKPEQAHELLKRKMLGVREMTDPDGEVIELSATTTTLDTSEFGNYVDKCAAWLAEFCGIVVLDPKDYMNQPVSLKQQLKQSIKIARQRKKA